MRRLGTVTEKQGPPFCVQIELTEGCNLSCKFCGINGIREKPGNYKFMTMDVARAVADALSAASPLGWNPRIEFAMHGEPSLNPKMVEIIAEFRSKLPAAYFLMESNGAGFVKDPASAIMAAFSAGLDCLALDQYQDAPHLVPKVMAKLQEQISVFLPDHKTIKIRTASGTVVHYYLYPSCGPEGNPHQRVKKKRLVHILPIDTTSTGTHATINNHAGCGSPLNDRAAGLRCAKPFREISVRWDGGVAICCNDWRGTLPIGNLVGNTAEQIWNNPLMQAIRRKLYAGERDFGPCRGCDATSYRPGLLPDHKGKESLPPPTAEDKRLIAEALLKPSLSAVVPRPWETELVQIKK